MVRHKTFYNIGGQDYIKKSLNDLSRLQKESKQVSTVPPTQTIVQPQKNLIYDPYTKQTYDLLHDYTATNKDKLFIENHWADIIEHIGDIEQLYPTVGNKRTIFSERIPNNVYKIITGYAFYVLVQEEPVPGEDFKGMGYARPFEFFLYFAFDLTINGSNPIILKNRFLRNNDETIELRGWRVLSENPDMDIMANSDTDGFKIIAPPNSLLQVDFIHDGSLAPSGYVLSGVRNPVAAGVKMIGFYRPME